MDMRIHQVMLGIGGVQMLKALGLKVTAYHMNEGHAVLALERIRILIQEEGLHFEARQLVASMYLYNPHARASWD